MWNDNIVSVIPATKNYEEESVMCCANVPENQFAPIYVAYIAPHGSYGWSMGGHYDTQEEAEEAIRIQGWGGKVEKTTYYELYNAKI